MLPALVVLVSVVLEVPNEERDGAPPCGCADGWRGAVREDWPAGPSVEPVWYYTPTRGQDIPGWTGRRPGR